MSKSNANSCQADIIKRFDEKINKLEKSLPDGISAGTNCAELTLTNILDILGIDNFFFHNLIIPLAGGLGGYKSEKGWMGACGTVSGGCVAIGVIMGGPIERMKDAQIPMAYLKAAKFCSDFEKEFGSVVCSEICGCDFSTSEGMVKYEKNNVWKTTCYKFVIWAIDRVRKLTKRDLRKKWE